MGDYNFFIIKIIFNFKRNVFFFLVKENLGMGKTFSFRQQFSHNDFMAHITCVKIVKYPPHRFFSIFIGFSVE